MNYKKSKIISNEKVIDNIYKMVCEDENEVKAGQFYMLKLPAPGRCQAVYVIFQFCTALCFC